jgi:hypothetical protein
MLVVVVAAGVGNAAGDNTPRPQQSAAGMYRFTSPADARAMCGPRERQCQIGQFIVWCCRADQVCDNSYAGGCR